VGLAGGVKGGLKRETVGIGCGSTHFFAVYTVQWREKWQGRVAFCIALWHGSSPNDVGAWFCTVGGMQLV
jgi:hypothetical protein